MPHVTGSYMIVVSWSTSLMAEATTSNAGWRLCDPASEKQFAFA